MAAPNSGSSGGAINLGLTQSGNISVSVHPSQPNSVPTYLPPATMSHAPPSTTILPSPLANSSQAPQAISRTGPSTSNIPALMTPAVPSTGSPQLGPPAPSASNPPSNNQPMVTSPSQAQPGPIPALSLPDQTTTAVSRTSTANGPQPHAGREGSGLQMRTPRESGSIGPPKLPILRLKKKGGDDDSFEKQESSKNDSYCWVCHDGGDVLCCDQCPRVFHLGCCNLEKPPDDEDNEWICSVCQNIARKTKRSRPSNLCELLKLAVDRMSFPGTELFRTPVPPDIMAHYKEYVFHPMDLGSIKQRIRNNEYQSTREFLHDTEWILHNCTIYNGGKHALTKIAKNIVKVCMEDMREIELCPGCYSLTVKQPRDWFCIPCNPPHPVVLAKVRGYPLWPAKLISETKDKCDVRFFGQHDRSLVPKSEIQVLNGLPPKPSSKTKHWNLAMHELKMYGQNVETQRNNSDVGVKDKSLHILMKKTDKSGGLKVGAKRESPSKQTQQPTSEVDVALAIPPPIVQVTGETEKDDQAAGSMSDADISSPGTPPSLQIDLDGGSSRNRLDKSPNRGRAIPSGGRSLFDGIRSSQVSGTLDFPNGGGNSMQAVLMNPPSSQPNAVREKKKGGKAGASLSALISTLTQRRMVGQGSNAPVHVASEGGTAAVSPAAGGTPQNSDADMAKQKSAEESQDVTSSPFSSIYVSSNKTAIAVVDPNQKRPKRKTLKGATGEPPAKKARVAGSMTTGGGAGDLQGITDPAAYVAKIQEYGSAVIGALNKSASPAPSVPVSSAPVSSLPTVRPEPPAPKLAPPAVPQSDVTTTSMDVSPSTSTTSNSNSITTSVPMPVPGTVQPRVVSGGGSKKKKRLDKNRGRSPYKVQAGGISKPVVPSPPQKMAAPSVLSALTAAIATPTMTTTTQPAIPITTIAAQTPPSSTAPPTSQPGAASLLQQVSQLVASRHDSPGSSTGSVDVRGEAAVGQSAAVAAAVAAAAAAAAAAAEDSGISDYVNGNVTGLMADTMRRVNASFVTRVNQMTGPSEDMGYKYFMEKLMSSVKNVLVEMLSTFESKSRMSAKQLREQLHQCWPVSNSASAMEQLGKELRDEMKQSLEVVRASAALELEQVVNEVRRQVEKEKEIAVAEAKKKKWCSHCYKEAQYNCCYNANYCNEECQRADWENHSSNCTQDQHQHIQAPAKSAPPISAPPMAGPSVTSSSTSVPQSRGGPEPPQTSPLLDRSGKLPDGTGNRQDGNIGASGSGGPVGMEPRSFLSAGSNSSEGQVHAQQQPQLQQPQLQQPQLQQPQQQSTQAYMQAFQAHQMRSQAHIQQQQQHQQQQQSGGSGSGLSQQHGRMSPATIGLISGSGPAGSGQMMSSLSNGGPHVTLSSLQQSMHRQNTSATSTGGLRQEHHMHGIHSHQMDAGLPSHLATPTGLVDPVSISGGSMDHHITTEGMITTANTASPPNHIRNILLNAGGSSKGGAGVIAGTNQMMMGHQSPAPSHHPGQSPAPPPHHPGLHSSPLGPGPVVGGLDMHGPGGLPSSRGLNNSDHSASHNSSNSSSTGGGGGGMLHSTQPPISPATPSSEPPPAHSYGNWTYQSPHLIIGPNDSYGVPILPPMQATTPTTQNHTFFKATF